MGTSDLPGNGAQRPVPLAIELEPIIQYFDLIGSAIPLP